MLTIKPVSLMNALPRRTMAIVLLCCFLGSSCASLFSRKYYHIPIKSTPENASVRIVNRKGKVVYEGQTPATVPLKASAGYFRRGKYTITFSKEGYDDQVHRLRARVDGWYWVNLYVGIGSITVGVPVLFIGIAVLSPSTIAFGALLAGYGLYELPITMLIVDPATGKMYSLKHVEKEGVYGALHKSTSLRFESEADDWVLHIKSLHDLPLEQRKDLEYVGRMELRK